MANLIIKLVGDTQEFNAAIDRAQSKLGGFGQKIESAGGGFAAFGVAAGAALGAVAVASVELADKYNETHDRLITATQNVGENFDKFAGQVSATDKKMQALGFSSIDVENAIGTLTPATHDVGKATELMGVAADLARFKHESLAEATQLLVAIEAGRMRGLATLGIAQKDATGKTITAAEAIKKIADITHGQAEVYTKSWAGQLDILKSTATNVGIAIGEKLLPVVDGLTTGISAAVGWVMSANEATGGWLAKLALFGAGGAVAVAALAKITAAAVQAGQAIASAAESAALWLAYNPLVLPFAAGLVAVAVALHAVGVGADDASINVKKLTDAQLGDAVKQWADRANEAASQFSKMGDAQQAIVKNTFDLKYSMGEAGRVLQDSFDKALSDGNGEAERFIAAADKAGVNTAKWKQELEKHTQAEIAAKVAQNQHNDAVQQGVDQAQAAAQAIKEQQKALDDLGKVAGPSAVKLAQAENLSSDSIKTLVQNVKDIDKAFEGSFDKATNVIDKFKDKSHVDFQSFAKDMFNQLVAAQNWSTNIARLADLGINKGFLKQLVDAGPASAAIVQSILDNVKNGSIKTINNIADAQDKAKSETERHLNDLETGITGFANFVNGEHIVINLDTGQAESNLALFAQHLQQNLQTYSGLHIGSNGSRSFFRAEGGPVTAGQPYIVGEQGMELFVPKGSGTIIPNDALRKSAATSGSLGIGGGNVTINLTVNSQSLDPRTADVVVQDAVAKALEGYVRRTGPLRLPVAAH